jgi:uncharacterized membrane protein
LKLSLLIHPLIRRKRLIFFIHHIASAIQASNIIASVADETLLAVDRLFPSKLGQGLAGDENDQASLPLADRHWQAVPSCKNGYILSVDNAAFLRLAREHQTIVRMEHSIGDFVVKDTPLASLALDSPPDGELIAEMQAAYSIKLYRTVEQDPGFGIRQLVDIALRALSSGVNDTTTAVMCVDYLTAILSQLATRDIPSSFRSEEGELQVITIGPTFASLVAESFDQIRESAKGNVAIMLRMLGALQTIASQSASPSRRLVLREQAQRVAELAGRTIASPHDRERFESSLASALAALDTEPCLSTTISPTEQ